MKKAVLLFVLLFTAWCNSYAQTNIISVNPVAEQVMKGNYNPANYAATAVIDKREDISNYIINNVSADSLYALLDVLRTFRNRNTMADTNSATTGIGAARRWVYSKFEQYSAASNNRLIPSYLQFDQNVCSINSRYRNIFAVLPGTDLSDKSIVLVEAHIDTRCKDVCDTLCLAEGMEDNASGTALVMEMARVMSKLSFKRSIVFVLTIGEEQSLVGAEAFAAYCQQQGIAIRGVVNNDVVGGIVCGATASQPGCMGAGTIDSTNMRIFSGTGFNTLHKQFARFTKLEYKENIAGKVNVPLTINIMTPLDRTGRGGDHIPFTNKNFTSIRFCGANEHGDADVSNASYTDRQHTSDDILGMDTNGDMVLDSFFVNFNYLARMTILNGNTVAMAATGPMTPDFDISTIPGGEGLSVYITTQKQYQHYRVAIRSTTNDWDSVYTFTGSDHAYIPVTGINQTKFVSVASVDADGIESFFSAEKNARVNISDVDRKSTDVELLQNHPNPFDGETIISVVAAKDLSKNKAYISVRDIAGKEIKRMDISLKQGVNEILYEHGFGVRGTYSYSLILDGQIVETKRMVFAN